MIDRQRGVLNLYWVAIFSAVFAGLAMAAVFSMRYERNLFAEGWARLAGAAPAQALIESAKCTVGGGAAPMRRCVVDGKTVISNTECLDANPTSKTIQIHDTRGFEAPKKPVAPVAEPTSNPAIDKMVEKQLR